MNIWQSILAVVLAALSVMAIAVCGYALLYNGRLDVALVAGVVLLAMAQLFAPLTRPGGKYDDADDTDDLMTASNGLRQEHKQLRRRIDRMEADMASGYNAAAGQLDAQVRALEHSVTALTRQNITAEPQSAPQSAATVETDEAEFDASMATRQLDLFLEPIVRLSDNRTAYYRATLAVFRGESDRVPVSKIAREAQRAGFLGELDLTAFERATPVIRRLQGKGRDVAVFCPVNASSLDDEKFMRSLLSLLNENIDVASSLVIEITQATLTQLSDKGQEGLAHLAQLGATFALSSVRADAPDLVTLEDLGFAFILADVRLLVALKNESRQSGDNLMDQAARSKLQLIAADVAKQSEFAWIEDAVPLAYGAYFSPPRLVRHDITEPQEHAMVA